MDLITGNAAQAETGGTGWFLSYSPWTRLEGSDLLHVRQHQPLSGLCAKWYDHPSGHRSGADAKPISTGRTISILISEPGLFLLDFCPSPGFEPHRTRSVRLERQGDYAAWGEGLHHRWHCHCRATILTLRWCPLEP